VSVRHGAQTTAGNSGGPILDRSLAGVAAVHSSGFSVRAHGIETPLYHGAVPINLAVREFPKIFTHTIRPVSTEEQPALVAFYFLAEARRRAESSFETWPAGNWPATFALALLDGFAGNFESSAQRAASIANIAYDNPDAKIGAAFIYLLLGNYSRAWGELSDAQSIRSTPRAYLLQGWAMLQKAEELNEDGDHKGAAESTKKALLYYRVALELAPKAHWAVPARQVIRTLERLVGSR
jgi:tetratricopeptide (TPR) repeat protein